MGVNAAYAGRAYPPTAPYAVGREHLRDFARAVGATHPAHHDVDAARALGYPDVVAPPTFAVVVAQRAEAQLIADPEAGIAGVTVTLSGSNDLGNIAPVTVQTSAAGVYSFLNLRPGTYAITETSPAGYFDGKDTVGTQGGAVGNDAFNSIAISGGVSGNGYNGRATFTFVLTDGRISHLVVA